MHGVDRGLVIGNLDRALRNPRYQPSGFTLHDRTKTRSFTTTNQMPMKRWRPVPARMRKPCSLVGQSGGHRRSVVSFSCLRFFAGECSKWHGVNASSSTLCPGRHDTGHARVPDQLPHVFVGMNNDAKIHAVNRRISIGNVDFTLKIVGFRRQVSFSDRV
jgi:hypothetical protein